ncbi:MAG: hypothetical protein NT018_05840 [Armatimonadetes bacterium]|nr:hypothetical protein [Armatimonadota bacterium]
MSKQFIRIRIILFALLAAAVLLLAGCGGSNVSDNYLPNGSAAPPPLTSVNHWSTGFEESEGYNLGTLGGQKSWNVTWEGHPGQNSAEVSNEMAATGSQSLKLDSKQNYIGAWWENIIAVASPEQLVDIPLKSVTLRLKVWRDPGQTEYPAGSGIMHPNIWFNQWFINDVNDSSYFGDAYADGKLYPALDGDRNALGTGCEQIAGRFVEVVTYDDFVQGKRTLWYDGVKVGEIGIDNPTKKFPSFVLGYQSLNPTDAEVSLSKPTYIDDIDIAWEPLFN